MAFHTSPWLTLSIATITSYVGIAGGVFYSESRRRLRVAVPMSAVLLLGVALLGLLPEIAHDLSWPLSLLLFAAGFGTLTVLDRAGISICPACADEHDHHHCAAPLHGFATPLLIAAAIHSAFDGWALAIPNFASAAISVALPLAIVLHKLPEGFALGGFVEASLRSKGLAIGLAMLAETMTLLGGAASLGLASRLGSAWTNYPLGLTGGVFVFLAYHALHEEWRRMRRGTRARALAE